MRAAEAIVAMLKAYDVEYIFGVPGDTSTSLYDALFAARDAITHVLARDERTAAFMADAYARLSGKPGVCEAPSGAGATYLLPGLAEANGSSIPLIALTTDIPLAAEGRNVLTEMDQAGLFAPVTKWRTTLRRGEMTTEVMRKAFRLATSGRPGAVQVTLPAGATFALDASTSNGRITVGFPITTSGAASETLVQGRIGDVPEVAIEIETSNGDVTVEPAR